MQFLIFRLYGPMASWGEAAPGEVRPTDLRPTRSALLGLLAAALGVDRKDEEAHTCLAEELDFGLRLHSAGVPVVDYHTSQLRKPSARWRPATRAEQLDEAPHKLVTVLSRRDYRCDALVDVAVWLESTTPRFSLKDLEAALRRPVFTLYLGRKACPPGLPLFPALVDADTLREAFEKAPHKTDDQLGLQQQLASRLRSPARGGLYWPASSTVEPGVEAHQSFERRDEPVSRQRRTFRARWECFAPLTPDSDEESSRVS